MQTYIPKYDIIEFSSDLQEDFKKLPGHMKKAIAQHFEGGQHSDDLPTLRHSGPSKLHKDLNNRLKSFKNYSHVIHINDKPVAMIHRSPDTDKSHSYDSSDHSNTSSRKNLNSSEAHAHIDHILSKHGEIKSKEFWKNNDVRIKSYGKDRERLLISRGRSIKRSIPPGLKSLESISRRTGHNLARKKLPNAPDKRDEYYNALKGLHKGTEWDKKYSRNVINDLKAAGHLKETRMHLEPRYHIMQQLQRAKLSMCGGSEVIFEDGSTQFVTGREATLALDAYAALKPLEKYEFQTFVGSSYSALKEQIEGE